VVSSSAQPASPARGTLELADHPSVMGSQAELMQLLAYLLVNAHQAKGAGPNRVRVTAGLRGPKALVSISDTGTGIPAEDLPKVFLPFFTTRAIGQGKGLGLPVALGIAQGLGGSVELVSTLGQGTAVTVTLPIAGGG
jgi:C4-dicarboxylate-specific signal transduction histidine kinase